MQKIFYCCFEECSREVWGCNNSLKEGNKRQSEKRNGKALYWNAILVSY